MTRKRSAKKISRRKIQSGSTLIELMIAMLVLAVGLGALTPVFTGCILSNTKNSKDTTATLLAQKVVEELTAQNTNSNVATLLLTDCAGNTWTVPITQGDTFANGGQGANLAASGSPYYPGIDFTQSYSNITSGFAMQYVDCDTNGMQTTYDVRWNIVTVTANSTRLITVSAQRMGNSGATGLSFTLPVTLRAIGAA